MAACRRRGTAVAILLLDLNRFKVVNDSLGHHLGDEHLRQVSARLRTAVRAGDTLARFGSNEFTVLIDDPNAPPGNSRRAIAGHAQ